MKAVILQVLPELESGGVERGTVEIVKALSDKGYTAIVASAGGKLTSQIEKLGGKNITLPLDSKNPLVIYNNIRRLVKVIKQHKVDIVHARSRAPAWSAYFACKQTGCHFITTVHGPYDISGRLKKYYNSVMVRGERVIAVSKFIRDYITSNYTIDEKKVTVIHRGADLSHFDKSAINKQRILHTAEELKIEHSKPIILLPGRITSWKGHEFLLEALVKIDKDKYCCIFVGKTDKHLDYLLRLNKKISELGLSENVKIINHIDDMPTLYSLSDIVISSSMLPEAFGRVAVEAQAMENLVIATNHGGACETVIDGKTGWLVKPGDVDQLARLLNKLLNLSAEEKRLVTSQAKEHISNNFSLVSMCDKTIEIYNQILQKKI
jgi:glycosyltransferase involved in cell wall biosynthesis